MPGRETDVETETEATEAERDAEAEETTETVTTELMNWRRLVALVQAAFREGRLEEEATWQAVALIPKGRGNYRGIGLLEVLWNVVTVIINLRFTSSIAFHDVLHGFWEGHGTGTASLEAKLLQQLAAIREEVLY